MTKLLMMIFSLWVAGCSVNIKKPNNRFMTPEVSGQLGSGRFGAFITGATNIEVVEDKFDDAPETDPELSQSTDLGLEVNLGLTPRLDVYYSANFEGPGIGGVKFQVLGDNLANSKAGNFSLTPFGGLMWGGLSSETKSDDETATSRVRLSGMETGVSLGYRPKDLVLIYLTLFYSRMLGDTIVDQEENGTTRRSVVDIGGEGEFKTASVGLQFGKTVFFQLELAYTESSWRRTHPSPIDADKLGVGYGGVNTGLSW